YMGPGVAGLFAHFGSSSPSRIADCTTRTAWRDRARAGRTGWQWEHGRHAVLHPPVPRLLPRRLHPLLGVALAPRPRLAAAGRQPLLLRLLEPLARLRGAGLVLRRLFPRPRPRRLLVAALAKVVPAHQHPRQPRPPVLLQVLQLLPPLARGRPAR